MKTLLCFVFICASYLVNAQAAWTNYNTGNSLIPDNSVRCINFENDSTVWMGTDYGLVKQQGATWTLYNTTNSGISYNDIRSICIDKKNRKWIGTFDGGISIYDDLNWTVFNTSNSPLPDNFVKSIGFDTAGVAWIGSGGGGGLSEVDTSYNWQTYVMFSSALGSNNIAAIYVDSATNDKYIGTINGGMLVIQNNVFTNYSTMTSGIQDNTQLGIIKDNLNNIWIASSGNGLIVKPPTFGWFYYSVFNSSIPSSALSCLDIASDQTLWIGSVDAGLIYRTGSTFGHFYTGNSPLTDDHIQCVRVAPDGKIWMGTAAHGVFVLDPSLLTGLHENTKTSTAEIFPNPASGGYVQLRCTTPGKSIQLFDISGRTVMQQMLNNQQTTLDLKNLIKGIYILRIEFADGNFISKKVLVE
jgi:ligand-binding sensor domain-containing protein